MKIISKRVLTLSLSILIGTISVCSQNISNIRLSSGKGLAADCMILSGGERIYLNKQKPLFTLRINDVFVSSDEDEALKPELTIFRCCRRRSSPL